MAACADGIGQEYRPQESPAIRYINDGAGDAVGILRGSLGRRPDLYAYARGALDLMLSQSHLKHRCSRGKGFRRPGGLDGRDNGSNQLVRTNVRTAGPVVRGG
jgi:hypothetical protein